MTAPAIRLRGVSAQLRGRAVLEDIDLEVALGTIVGLTGHNGAGKTTLLRTILGDVIPTSGTVQLFGDDAARGRHAVRRRVALSPQHPYPTTTPVPVRTAVAFGRFPRVGVGRRLARADWRAVDRMVARLDLTDLAATPVTELSGGQNQRVNLARAFAAEPSLLLLDEPTSHLDGPSVELVLGLIADYRGTVLLVTHGAGTGICDTIHRLAGGRLVA